MRDWQGQSLCQSDDVCGRGKCDYARVDNDGEDANLVEIPKQRGLDRETSGDTR